MKTKSPGFAVVAAMAIAACLARSAEAANAWSRRSGTPQNTANAGSDPDLQPYNVADLEVLDERFIPTQGFVNHTPVVTEDGLLIVGDWQAYVYVVDVAQVPPVTIAQFRTTASHGGAVGDDAVGHLGNELSGYYGVQATPTLARVRVPGKVDKERRVYIGANSATDSMYCLNLDAIAAARAAGLRDQPGEAYFCEGPDGATPWPMSLSFASQNGTMNGSPLFSEDQQIKDPVSGEMVTRDVLFTPSTGLDCANGQFYAIDGYTGELYWTFDAVMNGKGVGGTIWTTPAMNAAKTKIYVTTGDCVGTPQSGEKAESLVALDAATGAVDWHHQRRLVDTADLDIGTGPVVADVALPEHQCHVVVSFDKDGCAYGFPQDRDVPAVGDTSFDPLRMDQQRLLYRKCFVPGSLNGGFNASNPAFDPKTALIVQQASGYPTGHVGADDANAFAIDACDGRLVWVSSDVDNGRLDAAIVSGMLVQLGSTRKPAAGDYPYEFVQDIQIVGLGASYQVSPPVLATVALHAPGGGRAQPSLGGGGVAIAGGKIYAPTTAGVVVVGLRRGADGKIIRNQASAPQKKGSNIFAGPYPQPIAPGAAGGGPQPVVDAGQPYPFLVDQRVRCNGAYAVDCPLPFLPQ